MVKTKFFRTNARVVLRLTSLIVVVTFPLVAAVIPFKAKAEGQSYEEIVNDLEGSTSRKTTPSVSKMPVGGYFSIGTGTFSNEYYELRGNRYTPEIGLFVPGKLRAYAFTSLLSGTRENYASQEFANPGLGFDLRLLNLSRMPQMDLWLNTQARMAASGDENSLATPADSYRVGGTVVNYTGGLRSQMSGAFEFRTNEQIVGVDYGDRSDFHFDLSFETFDGIFIGADANWYVVMPLREEGQSPTPTVSWLTVGPRVEVGLFSGLDINLLLLYPTELSHSEDIIERTVADVHTPRLNGPTFSLSLEAGI